MGHDNTMRTRLLAAAAMLAVCVCFAFATPLSEDTSRIVNGIPATNLQFPYAISLQATNQLSQQTRGHSCGGALVTLQHAVTSGSCLYTANAQGVYVLKTPAAYRVFAGAALLTNDTSVDRWRTVSAFTPHFDYSGPPSIFNDIGIITLVTAFPNSAVTPIAMSAAAAPAEFTECTVAGWGATSFDNTASNTQLMYARKYIYSQDTCSFVLNPQPSAPNVLPLHVCAASYSQLVHSCTNDTGNALVCGGALAGVLVWLPPCTTQSSWPDLYTRTANYSQWARGVTGAASAPAPAPALAALLLLATAALAHVFTSPHSF